jgi:5-formaminoimidazole-4-carboxamide-1-beta-D-ribofuranosyl 5'-monophosphate synthetase
MWKQRDLLAVVRGNRHISAGKNLTHSALAILAAAYEEMGYKAVAMALRKYGANAEKFKTELRAVELAILHTRSEDAKLAAMADSSGKAAAAIRQLSCTV